MTLFLWLILSACTLLNMAAGVWFMRAITARDELAGNKAGVAIGLWLVAYSGAVFVCGYLFGTR